MPLFFVDFSGGRCFRMKLNTSFPASGCQRLIEVDDERKLRSVWPQKLLLTLWMKNGKAMWWELVVGMKKQGFPIKQVSFGRVCWLPVRGIPVTDQELGTESRPVQGRLMDANLSSQLDHRKTWPREMFLEKDLFLVVLILLCLIAWGPKELVESADFSVPLRKMMSPICCEKEG